MVKHALRNFIPVLTVTSLQVGFLCGNIVETTMGLGGLRGADHRSIRTATTR
jgi:ABC-type dipeptide/oligopeptide/nickel transport system permease component